jgi:hypothetical protein
MEKWGLVVIARVVEGDVLIGETTIHFESSKEIEKSE